MRKLRQGIVITLLAFISGCAFVGGFLRGDDCQGQDCETRELFNSPSNRQEWFCYATIDGRDWDCVHQKDTSRINRSPDDTHAAAPTAVITSLPEIQDAPSPGAGPQPTQGIEPDQALPTMPEITAIAKTAPAAETTALINHQPDSAPEIPAATETSAEPTSASTPVQAPAPELAPILASLDESETLLASVSTAPESASADQNGSSNEQILQHPRDSWAVQLLAMQHENSVVNYAKSNGLSYPLYARINNQGTAWYILLLGIYSDLPAANIARDEWEKDRTLTTKPWIRRLGPLQDAVRAAGEG